MRFPVWVLLAGLTAGCSFAQDAAQPEAPLVKTCPLASGTGMPSLLTVTKGMPFSAKRVYRCEVTLADGTVLRNKKSFLEWRDSLGRIRIQALDREFEDSHELYVVQVNDTVDHILWQWDEGKDSSHQTFKTAYKYRHEYEQWPTDYRFGPMLDPGPNFKVVPLEPIWINGVYAAGVRDFQLCQPGEYGNKTDRPAMIMVNETWISVDLGETVKTRTTDSSGRKDMEDLYVLDRREPDPSLFVPPAGNEILETRQVGDAVDERPTEEPSDKAQQPDLKAPAGAKIVIMSPTDSPTDTTVAPADTAPPEH